MMLNDTLESKQKIRVLLLEDEKLDAEMILRQLRQTKFEPEWKRVETQSAFLAALDEFVPQLILADYNLPQFDGLTALSILRERGFDTPFILISGTVGEEIAVSAIKNGADDYLLKDRLARLGFAVAHALENKQIRDERKQAEIELLNSEERWRFALEGAGAGVWDWNVQTGEVVFSKRWMDLYGYAEREFPNRIEEWEKRIHPEDIPRVMADIQAYFDEKTPAFVNEHRILCKSGDWKWVFSRGMLISRSEDGKPLRVIGTHTDITERKQAEQTIWSQANFDPLTGLPNRYMFHNRLEQEIKKAHRTKQPLALLFLDLDRFKEVNDTLGHAVGDALLKEAAERLCSSVRDTDTVARLGGDEFTIILSDLDNFSRVETIAEDILQKISIPFRLGEELAYVSASIGITLYPEDAFEIDALLKNADQAMYAAKNLGRNRHHYFTPSMQEAAQRRMRLTLDLRSALAQKQFWIAYQPIVELATGSIRKAEALIRWQHPSRGLIGPNEFIPISEDTGLIVDIGEWAFREAAKQAKHWRTLIHPEFQISVNKSPVQFNVTNDTHAAWVDYLTRLGLPGQSITVEITERLLLDADTTIIDKLLGFRDAGIQVALDDFGTGYSSLSYLKKFNIDYLKIDQSFVRNLSPNSDDMVLCEAIIVMAHKLGMQAIAEGVETEEQKELLIKAGCDYAQGWLFSEALPAKEFEERFKNKSVE